MSERKTNLQLAQEISARIGQAPVPFDSVYSVALDIYNELGGEPAEFDTVYSILLETLPLAESVAKKTSITEVDELPDAQDNNNIYRLSSDDKVYMSKHVSTEYTNRLPDDEQIDTAFLFDYSVPEHPAVYYYNGLWKIICSDGEIEYYGWLDRDYFSGDWLLWLTNDNAENFNTATTLVNSVSSDEYEGIILDVENKTVTFSEEGFVDDYIPVATFTDSMPDGYYIPAIYNAPEADCISNAYIIDDEDDTWTYTGEVKTIEDNGISFLCYSWVYDNNDTLKMYSTKPASDIYVFNNEEPSIAYTDARFYIDGDFIDFTIAEIYIPQLNAPDSEQVGKAYIDDEYISQRSIYTGEKTNIEVNGDQLSVYIWRSDFPDFPVYSTKPAYEIYNTKRDSDNVQFYINDTGDIVEMTFENNDIQDISTIKYSREIKTWEWKQIPTMDDIPIIPQPTLITLDSSSDLELAKLNPYTEIGVYNDVNIQIKLDNIYYPASLVVFHPGINDRICQRLKIYGYTSDTYFYEEWQIERYYINGNWRNNPMIYLALYNPEEI